MVTDNGKSRKVNHITPKQLLKLRGTGTIDIATDTISSVSMDLLPPAEGGGLWILNNFLSMIEMLYSISLFGRKTNSKTDEEAAKILRIG